MEVSSQLDALKALSLAERVPDTPRTGSWVGPRARLNVLERKKSHAPARNETTGF
jgi:hypothetical protein